MKSRHRAREIALQILYQYDLASQALVGPKPNSPQGSDLTQDLLRHYDHFAVPQELREFVGQLVAGTLSHVKQVDELLEKHASNWKVARMSPVDRSLLRMAIYEMTFLKELDSTIVMDEAIELAKQFGALDSSSFINGILDSVKKSTA